MRNICTIDGCGKFVKGHRLCNTHYKRRLYIDGDIGPALLCSFPECSRKHYGNNLCRKHYDAKRRAANQEYQKQSRLRYLSNPVNVEKGKAYRVATAARKLEYDRAYRASHREKVRAVAALKSARRRGASGSYTEREIAELFRQQKGRCAICRCKLGDNYHRDHIEPIALGGTNWIRNIQLLCPPCNLAKSYKHPVDFMQSLGRLL